MLLTFQAKLAPCSMFYNAFDSWNWNQFNPGDSRSKSSCSKAFLGESGGVEANNAGETVEARLRLRARKTQPPMQYAMIGVFNLPSLLSKDLGAHEACPNGTCIWYCLIGDSLVNHFVSSLAAVLIRAQKQSSGLVHFVWFCMILLYQTGDTGGSLKRNLASGYNMRICLPWPSVSRCAKGQHFDKH